MMTRLIDANSLHRKVMMETNPYGKPTIDYDSGVKVLEWIDKAPTLDAVPVVRCRDCRKFKTYGCRMVASGYDDFCSYGERKDGDD